ncbi:MAG: alpha/beta hydrolase [Sphingomonas sp.]
MFFAKAILLSAAAAAATAAPPATVRQVPVAPDVTLKVVEAGKGDAPTLVLIPGWSAGADIWREQIATFSASRRVIALDPRSQGDSTKAGAGNTPEQRAQDLHALLAALRVRRPVLVGWSQAAQDVAAYVTRYGADDLAGIVLVDAAVSDGAAGIAARPAATATQFARFAIYTSDQEAYLRGMFGAIIGRPQPAGAIDQLVATAMKTPPSTGLAMLVADMFGIDRTPALGKMTCPVLIVAAGTSGELDRQEAELKAIPHARFARIDDAAHAVFVDQPARFDAALADFLRGL